MQLCPANADARRPSVEYRSRRLSSQAQAAASADIRGQRTDTSRDAKQH